MDKLFSIMLQSKEPDAAKMQRFYVEMGKIGTLEVLIETPNWNAYLLRPQSKTIFASQIRDALREHINPFDDALLVMGVNTRDYASTDSWSKKMLIGSMDEEWEAQRNFSRFETKTEAKRAYELEKPKWVNPHSGGVIRDVAFEDWCWLPIHKDGIYKDEMSLANILN